MWKKIVFSNILFKNATIYALNSSVFSVRILYFRKEWNYGFSKTHIYIIDPSELCKGTYCIIYIVYMVYIIFFSSSNCTDERNNNNIKPVDPYARVNLPEVCPSVLLYAPWGGVSVGRRPSFSQHIATAAVHPVSCEVPLANKRSKYVARRQKFRLNLVNLVKDYELLKYSCMCS